MLCFYVVFVVSVASLQLTVDPDKQPAEMEFRSGIGFSDHTQTYQASSRPRIDHDI